MSELKRELIEQTITKKHIIGVIILVGILITSFAFSVFFVSLIFGTQRKEPSSNLKDAEREDAEQLKPHFPIDLDDLWEYLNDLDDLGIEDIEDLENLGINISEIDETDLENLPNAEEVADFIQEMTDGDIDNYDLAMAGLIIAALLFSNVEVFRVYDYEPPITQREDFLWKYECFDQFNGEDWQCTVPMEYSTWPTYEDFTDDFEPYGSDLIKIKRALSTISGSNSMVLGSIFPVPNIIEEHIIAPYLDNVLLFKNEFGCASGDLYFNTAIDLNMTYELFDLYVPTPDEINNTAVDESYTPLSIKNKYLQLPGGIDNYIQSHDNFNYHYEILDSIINSGDNAFVVAYKIRDYLQKNFVYSFDQLLNDGPNEDVVEWFCDKREGLSSEFASAFCAFTRAFGVSSRFVDGFNSKLIEEFIDYQEGGKWTYPIKYKNIYNWAEIYVPRDTLGSGQWVQMDVLYDTYGDGGQPITTERFNISVLANSSKFFEYNKGQFTKLTAKINSTESNIVDRTITFRDVSIGQTLGSNRTDSNGFTSILVSTDSQVVGPHVIEGSIGADEDSAIIFINGDVNVNLNAQSPSPAEVNVSISPHTTFVQGFIRDSANSKGVPNARVNFLLLYKGTNTLIGVPNYFSPMDTYSDSNGRFDTTLIVSEYISYGEYDFRVDFNGTWLGFGSMPNINDSSDVRDFNVTKELTYDILFYVNKIPTRFPNAPIIQNLVNVKRTNQINLTAIVLDAETNNRVEGVPVDFYNYSNGNMLIGSDISDAFGSASIVFTVGNNRKAGPNLVYSRIGNVRNYSYYIINDSIGINLQSYSNPLQIDINGTGSTTFNVQCVLIDNKNNPIPYSQIEINMNRSSIDYSNYITPSIYVNPTSLSSNAFSFNRGVLTSTPVNNYSLRLEFNGYFNFSTHPYPYIFILNYLNNYTYLTRQLKIWDSQNVKIFLNVEGYPTREFYDETNPPRNYTRGTQTAHFQVRVVHGASLNGKIVRIWDEYSNKLLGSYTFTEFSSGSVQFNISTNKFYHAGIHKIKVQYETYSAINTTFIVINETVNVNVINVIDTPRTDNVVLRNSEGFTVSGYIMENGTRLRGLRVSILLLDRFYKNVSHYLIGNLYGLTSNNGYFSIFINRINSNCPYGQYYVRIDFNGSINIQIPPGINLINNFMVSNSSSYVPLNITAGTIINQINWYTELEFIDENIWIIGDILHVFGNLTWDNNTRITNMYVNVTVQFLNGTIIEYNSTVITNGSGEFHGLITIGAEWPTKRSDTKIVVYFKPKINNLENVEKTEKIFI